MSNMNPPAFNPTKYECAKCHSIIMSSYPGQYVSCKCGAIAIDQTEYYTRCVGEMRDFWRVEE
jgi:hypothetical protein